MLVVKSLAAAAGKITYVSLLGSTAQLDWKQTPGGLVVTVPTKKVSEYTCGFEDYRHRSSSLAANLTLMGNFQR